MLIPTPDKDDDPVSLNYSRFIHLSVVPTRATPLPALGWANRDDVWKNMINKEETYVRDKLYMQRHPQLQPKMRAILLDWLMEVCEAYKLHRETFYLAQDFFDRFMATQQDVVKTLLQLIGVTSLFIAAKLEEIYPPKLHQFAYVTDGACTEDEIISMELIIMKALNWNLNPLTVVSWLNVYMQVAYLNELYEVMLPQYPQQIFVQITELLDLCVLDIGCLEYTYGILAASALYHFSSSELMQKVSGYEFCEIEECVKWMVPFAMALREVGSSKLKHFSGIAPEDLHNIQTHINSFDLLVWMSMMGTESVWEISEVLVLLWSTSFYSYWKQSVPSMEIRALQLPRSCLSKKTSRWSLLEDMRVWQQPEKPARFYKRVMTESLYHVRCGWKPLLKKSVDAELPDFAESSFAGHPGESVPDDGYQLLNFDGALSGIADRALWLQPKQSHLSQPGLGPPACSGCHSPMSPCLWHLRTRHPEEDACCNCDGQSQEEGTVLGKALKSGKFVISLKCSQARMKNFSISFVSNRWSPIRVTSMGRPLAEAWAFCLISQKMPVRPAGTDYVRKACTATAEGTVAGKLPVEKDPELWLAVAEHEPACAQAHGILACVSNSVASRTRAVIVPQAEAL
ncbi:hypothetical protein BTVI_59192 [Pitangus sulphuratus]|nr:hypothetical protein BTVI_59192 [Pitangus sulphuratus]